jgi:hypothetical protein
MLYLTTLENVNIYQKEKRYEVPYKFADYVSSELVSGSVTGEDLYINFSLLGAFAKLRKLTVSIVISLQPSA